MCIVVVIVVAVARNEVNELVMCLTRRGIFTSTAISASSVATSETPFYFTFSIIILDIYIFFFRIFFLLSLVFLLLSFFCCVLFCFGSLMLLKVKQSDRGRGGWEDKFLFGAPTRREKVERERRTGT